jgi:hypothetical protein
MKMTFEAADGMLITSQMQVENQGVAGSWSNLWEILGDFEAGFIGAWIRRGGARPLRMATNGNASGGSEARCRRSSAGGREKHYRNRFTPTLIKHSSTTTNQVLCKRLKSFLHF